jgi:hypothetical protein
VLQAALQFQKKNPAAVGVRCRAGLRSARIGHNSKKNQEIANLERRATEPHRIRFSISAVLI